MMELAGRGRVANFLEQAEMARAVRGIDDRHSREWQLAVYRRARFVADKEVERGAGRKIEHVERDEAVVEIAGRAVDDGGGEIERKRDRAAVGARKRPRAEVHVLGVVEELDLVVCARIRHGGDAQKSVLHNDDRVGLAILPEAAVGQRKARGYPVALAGNDRRKVRVFDDLVVGRRGRLTHARKDTGYGTLNHLRGGRQGVTPCNPVSTPRCGAEFTLSTRR